MGEPIFKIPPNATPPFFIYAHKGSVPLCSLYRPNGSKRIADNTLVALTLMIAESRTEEKDVMVKVVVNLINQQN